MITMLVSALCIFWFAQSLWAMVKSVAYSASKAVVSVASQTLGSPMIKDELGHINILLL